MTKEEFRNEIAIAVSNIAAWIKSHPWPAAVFAALVVGFILGKAL